MSNWQNTLLSFHFVLRVSDCAIHSKQQNIEQNERLAIFNAIKMQLHLISSSVYLFSCFHFKCISHWIRALLWCYVRCACTTLTNTNTFSLSFCNNIFLLPSPFHPLHKNGAASENKFSLHSSSCVCDKLFKLFHSKNCRRKWIRMCCVAILCTVHIELRTMLCL